MTRVSRVVSTTTKLSDDTDRKLTASAGYDSLVHVHCSTSRGAPPSSSAPETPPPALLLAASAPRNGSRLSRAGSASLVLALEPRLSRSGEGCSSAAPPSSSAPGTPPPSRLLAASAPRNGSRLSCAGRSSLSLGLERRLSAFSISHGAPPPCAGRSSLSLGLERRLSASGNGCRQTRPCSARRLKI